MNQRFVVAMMATLMTAWSHADLTELSQGSLNQSYISGISIPHVNKKVPCAGSAQGVSRCNVAENQTLSDDGQGSLSVSGTPLNAVGVQTALSAMGTEAPIDAHATIPTSSGLAVQNGQQVTIQLMTPMNITTNASSPSVDINTGPTGAVIHFNLPSH